MKKLIILAASLLLAFNASSQTIEALAKKINRPLPTTELMTARAQLERLCTDTAANWLTLYYLAYADIELSFRMENTEQKLLYIKEAQDCLLKINGGDVSEVETLRGYAYFALMAINPAENGPRYAQDILACLGKALQINPDNPRAVVINAIFKNNMYKSMGSRYKEFETDMNRCRKLFDGQDTTSVKPCWGSVYLEQ
ncbi:MAG: hypothetical protein LBC47_11185 [Tannerella sp.]|jgi:hypothetical protein|nr:hypothetical protein [Tannerella sp.]